MKLQSNSKLQFDQHNEATMGCIIGPINIQTSTDLDLYATPTTHILMKTWIKIYFIPYLRFI